MISVIIPYSEDTTYLMRCINSVKRQKYKEKEILLVGCEDLPKSAEDYNLSFAESLEEACRNAKGDWILFCSVSSVLAPNVLGTLLEKQSGMRECYVANCLKPSDNMYVSCTGVMPTIYAKLFDRDVILELLESQDEKEVDWGTLVISYLNRCTGLQVLENTYIYENNPDIFWSNLPLSHRGYWLSKASVLPQQELVTLVMAWVEQNEYINKVDSKILLVAENLPNKKELHYQIAKKYVFEWYQRVIKDKDEILYEIIQKYFMLLNQDEMFQEIIANGCGITMRQLECLKKYDLSDYIFYYDKTSDEPNFMCYIAEIENMKLQLDALQRQSDRIHEQLVNNTSKTVVLDNSQKNVNVHSPVVKETVLQELQGPMLAEYVIERYRQGALGAGTIFKALIAWMKYKIKRG